MIVVLFLYNYFLLEFLSLCRVVWIMVNTLLGKEGLNQLHRFRYNICRLRIIVHTYIHLYIYTL